MQMDYIRIKKKVYVCFVVESCGWVNRLAFLWKETFEIQIISYIEDNINTRKGQTSFNMHE